MGKKTLQTDFNYSFTLISIVTPAKAHRLCSLLNEELDLSLRKVDHIEVPLSSENDQAFFDCFKHEAKVDHIKYYLIANKNEGHCLLPERKITDFFLLIEGQISSRHKKDIFQQLRSLSIIQMSFEENVEELPSKENLIMT